MTAKDLTGFAIVLLLVGMACSGTDILVYCSGSDIKKIAIADGEGRVVIHTKPEWEIHRPILASVY